MKFTIIKGLHEIGVIHRDLKASNIFLKDNVAKIGDLGFAKIINNDITTTVLGTIPTMAP